MLSQFLSITLKKVIPALLCLLPALSAISQLSVGSTSSLSIATGTTFSTDSLILIPSGALTISNNSIVKVATPIGSTTPGVTSLLRVYNIGTPITYSGTLGLVYRDAELGGNTEGLLQIAYAQTAGGTWTTSAGSTVNTLTNYVNNTFSALPVANVTAAASGIILPIIFSNFFAQLNDQYILVNWQAESTIPLSGFTIESSTDGNNWKTSAYVPAIDGETAYSFKDADLNFSVRYYRIVIIDASGKSEYTNIVIVHRPTSTISLQITSNGNDRVVNFSNAPDGIQLYDINGRLLKKMDVSRQSYQLGNLPPGVYILHFKVATEQNVRKVFLP